MYLPTLLHDVAKQSVCRLRHCPPPAGELAAERKQSNLNAAICHCERQRSNLPDISTDRVSRYELSLPAGGGRRQSWQQIASSACLRSSTRDDTHTLSFRVRTPQRVYDRGGRRNLYASSVIASPPWRTKQSVYSFVIASVSEAIYTKFIQIASFVYLPAQIMPFGVSICFFAA